MKNKSIIIALAIVVLVVAVAVFYAIQSGQKQTSTSGPIKIGAVLPITGGFASFGEEINRGALLAIDELKQNGVAVNYDVEDDQSEAKGSVNAANKLIQSGVQLTFTATVQEVKPIAPIFNNAKIPLLATWDSNEFIRTAGPYVFTIGFSTEGTGEKMADYAYNTLKLRHVVVIYKLDEWSKLISSSFANKFSSLGGDVVMNEGLIEEAKDFRTPIIKAKSKNPDGVYLPLQFQDAGTFFNQSKQLGLNAVMMTGDSFSQDDVKIAGRNAEGAFFTNVYAKDAGALTEKYKYKYQQDPFDIAFASFGYDAIKVLVEANNIASRDGISLRDALARVDINGAGARISMNGKQYSDRVEKIFRVNDGKFIEVE